MDIFEAVTVNVGEEEITPPVYKLSYSHVLLVDVTNHSFAEDCIGDKVKINLKFKDHYKKYWCKFQCGENSIELIGHHSIVFSGFSDKNCACGAVRAFKLNDSSNMMSVLDEKTKRRLNSEHNENNVIVVTLHNACEVVTRRSNLQADCVDGISSKAKLISYNDEEESDIFYPTTDKYYEGAFQARFYIILYKNYKRPIRVY